MSLKIGPGTESPQRMASCQRVSSPTYSIFRVLIGIETELCVRPNATQCHAGFVEQIASQTLNKENEVYEIVRAVSNSG